MRPQSLIIIVISVIIAERVTCRVLIGNNETIHGIRRFTIEELINGQFTHRITGDLDLDVCKAGNLF